MVNEGMNEINNYIIEHQQLVTSAYLIQTKEDVLPCAEIYIGISQTYCRMTLNSSEGTIQELNGMSIR